MTVVCFTSLRCLSVFIMTFTWNNYEYEFVDVDLKYQEDSLCEYGSVQKSYIPRISASSNSVCCLWFVKIFPS